MKKILSLALAMVMVLGMFVPSLAPIAKAADAAATTKPIYRVDPNSISIDGAKGTGEWGEPTESYPKFDAIGNLPELNIGLDVYWAFGGDYIYGLFDITSTRGDLFSNMWFVTPRSTVTGCKEFGHSGETDYNLADHTREDWNLVKTDLGDGNYEYVIEFRVLKTKLCTEDATTVDLLMEIYSEQTDKITINTSGVQGTDQTGFVTYAFVESYAASIEAATTGEERVGDTVTATITVEGKEKFASAGIDVYYDNTKLGFVSIAGADANEVLEKADGLKIIDVGKAKDAATHTYAITFTALDDGVAEITLASAGFSTAENAHENLTPATILVKVASVTIGKEMFEVTPPANEWFTAESWAVEDGSDFTFVADSVKSQNYDYGKVFYKIGENEPVEITPDENGVYTIPAVTGDVVISFENDVEPTGKTYGVVFNGNTAPVDKAGETANYGNDYWFVVPADKAKDQEKQEDGYFYTVEALIGEDSYTITNKETVEDGVKYTIPGADITDTITITITRVEDACEQVKIDFDGNGIGDATPNQSLDYTTGAVFEFTVDKDAAYDYTVNAVYTGTETAVTLTPGENGLYTIAAADTTADITITITKTLILTNSAITGEAYAGNMYLVTIDNAKREDGRVYKYDGNDMYWNAKYNAYCYLVTVDGEATLDTSLITLGAPAGELVEIAALVPNVNEIIFYDINKTGVNDANDAQFAYNAYNGDYTEITGAVTMEKLLRADVGGDKKVDTTDVQAIVNFLLGK